jgi:cellulose synthase/poly-beta-1,6-N-acetylglucosamine synthase-like glycosyltransferase
MLANTIILALLGLFSFGLIFLVTIYCAYILLFLRGLFKLKTGANENLHTFSVVIPARNEADNIESCLNSVLKQDYPQDKFEVIVVDDGSRDTTLKIAQGFAQIQNSVKTVSIEEPPEGISPKKYAVSKGIEIATGEVIVTTDADCIVQSGWLQGLNRYLEEGVGMVVGYTDYHREKNFWSNLEALDYFSHRACAAGALAAGITFTSTASNLAYRTTLFQEVGEFEEVGKWISGDDDLLLKLVSSKTKWKIVPATSADTYVITDGSRSFSEFFSRTTRWASKGTAYGGKISTFLKATVGLYLLFLVLLPLAIAFPNYLVFYWYALGAKLLCDFLLLFKAARIFGRTDLLKYYPVVALLHLPYLLLVVIWGHFGEFTWKGRKFRKQETGDRKQGTGNRE